jgi:hypothetical protein
MKVNEALRAGLARLDQAHLSPEARRVVELTAHLSSETGGFAAYAPAAEPRAEELLKLYRSVPERQRDQMLSIVRATATALRESAGTTTPLRSGPPDRDDATG